MSIGLEWHRLKAVLAVSQWCAWRLYGKTAASTINRRTTRDGLFDVFLSLIVSTKQLFYLDTLLFKYVLTENFTTNVKLRV